VKSSYSTISYFPINHETGEVIKVLTTLSLALLYAASLALYFIAGFARLNLVLANVLGGTLVYTSLRLVISHSRLNSWKLYKLSAFPYLGLIFLTMCFDTWLMSGQQNVIIRRIESKLGTLDEPLRTWLTARLTQEKW